MLVVVPLGLWVVRPGWRVLPWQVVAVAAALLVTGAVVAVLDRSGRWGAAGRQDQPVNGTSASTGSST